MQGWHPSLGPCPKRSAALRADNSAQPPGKTSWCCSWRPSSLILSLCPSEESPALPALRPLLLAVTAVTSPLGQLCLCTSSTAHPGASRVSLCCSQLPRWPPQR